MKCGTQYTVLVDCPALHFPAFIIEPYNLEMWHTVYTVLVDCGLIYQDMKVYNEGTGSTYIFMFFLCMASQAMVIYVSLAWY